jgi:hypothetical protein
MAGEGVDIAAVRYAQRQAAWEASAAARDRSKRLAGLIESRRVDGFAALAGSIEDGDVAEAVEPIIAKWTVDRALRALPGIGKSRAFEVAVAARIRPTAKVSALTFEQRAELARLARIAVR